MNNPKFIEILVRRSLLKCLGAAKINLKGNNPVYIQAEGLLKVSFTTPKVKL